MADIINEKSSKFKTKSQFKRNDGGVGMKWISVKDRRTVAERVKG